MEVKYTKADIEGIIIDVGAHVSGYLMAKGLDGRTQASLEGVVITALSTFMGEMIWRRMEYKTNEGIKNVLIKAVIDSALKKATVGYKQSLYSNVVESTAVSAFARGARLETSDFFFKETPKAE